MAAPLRRSTRSTKLTEDGKRYYADLGAKQLRETARKASRLEKLLTQAAQLREATGVDILEEAAVKDILVTKGEIYDKKTRIENKPITTERLAIYQGLLREEAPLESHYVKALSKALKAYAPAPVATAAAAPVIGLAPDEEAEVDAELMGLMGGLKMGGGARRRRTSRRHRMRKSGRSKSQRRH